MENALSTVTGAVDTCVSLFGTVIDTVIGHPVLVVIFAGGTFVPLAFKMYRKFKKS